MEKYKDLGLTINYNEERDKGRISEKKKRAGGMHAEED